MTETRLKEAVLWDPAADKKVQCYLCSHRCLIAEGKSGRCRVRKNEEGVLYSLNYDKLCSANPDPIEKKPLFHFQPGTRSFSVAAMGCNFQCDFCQNWQISQAAIETGRIDGQAVRAEQIVDSAARAGCSSVAYTYTEPTIFMELCADCGQLARREGLKNVFVSNGYMTREAVDFAAAWLDGINVDLKAFTEDFYQRLCKARLEPVLETIAHIAGQTNIWMELTTLLIPGENDSDDELRRLTGFIAEKAGVDVPWHVSRYHPMYKHQSGGATPTKSLQRAYEIGKEAGLRYIYLGNVPGDQFESTFCPGCGRMLIERLGYSIGANAIEEGKCPDCGESIAGVAMSG